jgi:hypothetical protein
MGMEWITVKEAGMLWGISTRRATVLCANGKIKDAQKLGSQWVMPKGTEKPIDGRTLAARKFKTINVDGGNNRAKD